MLCFDFLKRHMKEEKVIAPMDFAEYQILLNGKCCYISKSRWDVQYLEKCASHCLAKHPYKRFVEISFK